MLANVSKNRPSPTKFLFREYKWFRGHYQPRTSSSYLSVEQGTHKEQVSRLYQFHCITNQFISLQFISLAFCRAKNSFIVVFFLGLLQSEEQFHCSLFPVSLQFISSFIVVYFLFRAKNKKNKLRLRPVTMWRENSRLHTAIVSLVYV